MKKFIKGRMINLAEPRLGSKVIFKTDDFFASANRIINPNPPIFKKGVFDKHGHFMDGWESRRRRGKGFDWLIIKLGRTGIINKIEIDTHHFKGNYPDRCSVQATYIPKKISNYSVAKKSNKWKVLLNKVKLNAHTKHSFNNKTMKKNKINFIRINIYPDGGISRVRFLGKVIL